MMLCGTAIILAGILLGGAGVLLLPWYRLSFHTSLDLDRPLTRTFVVSALVFLVAAIFNLSLLRVGVQAIYDEHMLRCSDRYLYATDTQGYIERVSDMKGRIVRELWLRLVLPPSPSRSCYAGQEEVCRLADTVWYGGCDPSGVDENTKSLFADDEEVAIDYLRVFSPLILALSSGVSAWLLAKILLWRKTRT
jgi:hypothetical protein